jgi:hypothetical protein
MIKISTKGQRSLTSGSKKNRNKRGKTPISYKDMNHSELLRYIFSDFIKYLYGVSAIIFDTLFLIIQPIKSLSSFLDLKNYGYPYYYIYKISIIYLILFLPVIEFLFIYVEIKLYYTKIKPLLYL